MHLCVVSPPSGHGIEPPQLFIRAYTKAYADRKAGRPLHDDASLARSLHNGINAFILENAPFELNISESVRNSLIIDAKATSDPSILSSVQKSCEDALRESLVRAAVLSLKGAY